MSTLRKISGGLYQFTDDEETIHDIVMILPNLWVVSSQPSKSFNSFQETLNYLQS